MSAAVIVTDATAVMWCPLCLESWTYIESDAVPGMLDALLIEHCRSSPACAYKIFEVTDAEVAELVH